MSKTIFIPISEDMQVLHPVRTMHEDLRDDVNKVEDFVKRICQYIYVNGVMSNTHWKVKDYSINPSDDGTVVLVSYKQSVDTNEFPRLDNNKKVKINASPLPEVLHLSVL